MEVIVNWVSKLYPLILLTKFCKNLGAYVSDFCKEIYQQFLTRHTYLISCPTGRGKSQMVINKIIPLAFKQKKKVLLLVNRTRLAEQYLKDIRSIVVKGIIDYNPSFHSLANDYDHCLLVMTYQQLEYRLSNNLEATLLELDKYDIVVADEVHYWLNDSTFNPGNRLSAEAVLMYLCTKTRYLMSATMDEIKPILLQPGSYMKPLFTPQDRFYNPILQESVSPAEYSTYAVRNFEYIMPADYSYLDVHYFNKIDVIIDCIVNSNASSKWLIFINSRKRGRELVEKIKRQYLAAHPNCNEDEIVVFISSDYRDIEEDDMKDVMEEILEHEIVKAKVLVTTSVLDNGVSLKSKDLLHIVIFADNKVSFIQMLGRKRIYSEEEKVHLYIPAMDKSFFLKRLKRIEELFNDTDQVSFINFDAFMTSILYSGKDSRGDSLCKVAFPFIESINRTRHSHFIPNELSRYQLRLLYENYQKIIDRFETDGDSAFIKEQLDWLGLVYDRSRWLADNSEVRLKREFEQKLSPYLSKEFSGEILKRILKELKPEIRNIFKEIRSNRIYPKHLNFSLQSVGSDYRVVVVKEDLYKITDCPDKVELIKEEDFEL